MIDSHTHLDSCPPPNDELVRAAVDAGVTRILTVGMDGESCRAALGAAESFPQVFAAIGRHPNLAAGFDDAVLAEGLRTVTVLLWPWLPESVDKLLAALGTPDRSLRAAALDGARVQRVSALEPLFPKPT